MGRDKKVRAVELGKDVLIVLLTALGVWLILQTPLAAPLHSLLGEEGRQTASGQAQGGDRVEGALPLTMVVNLPAPSGLPEGMGTPEGTEGMRCAVQYDREGCQALFQQVAGPLAEALSNAGQPEPVSRAAWEAALTRMTGVYMDFQGEIPLPVLVGWLTGGPTQLTGTVRRLILTVQDGRTALYYQDADSGECFRCRTTAASSSTLKEMLTELTGNGAFYAFESELYEGLDPDTLLLPAAPVPAVYTAADPVSGGQTALEALVQDLGFSLNSTSFYSTDEQVARSGDDSVRLSDRGVAQYQYEGNGSGGLFPVLRQGEAGPLFDSVETCRQVALSALGSRCGEARLYLMSVTEEEGGWEIQFGCSLDGIPILLDQGCAARFQVRERQIVQFTLCLRSYTAAAGSSLVLPPRQAAAALAAQGLEGEELLLTYTDSGGDAVAVSAGWSARDTGRGEG